jgi:hypothetical protein
MLADLMPLLAIAALGLSLLTLVGRAFDKGLSIREHEVFKGGVENKLKELTDSLSKMAPSRRIKHLKADMLRDLKRIEDRLALIESTRPSNSELQTTSGTLSKRLDDTQTRIDETAKAAALREANTATVLATTTAASVAAAATAAAAAVSAAAKGKENK